MSLDKLDYPAARTTTGQRRPYAGVIPNSLNRAVLVPASKLDLPGTAQEFAGADAGPISKPFRFRDARSAAATAAGVATLDFGEPFTGWYWNVERLVVKGAGVATVYVGNVSDFTMSDFTPTASQDVADESSPIYVENGANLLVQFTGAGAGTICTATVQIQAVPNGM